MGRVFLGKLLLPLLIGLVLTLIFFFQLAFTDLILARGDTYAYFYPYWDARDAALAAGELPLWTNNLFMGAPLLANPQLGTFYPPNWLTITQPAPQAIKISILIHAVWGFVGVYWLAKRALSLSIVPALTAALIFTFGGYFSAHVEQINQYQGIAWIPWLFLLLDCALRKPLRCTPILGAAWAMQILTGHTQLVFMSGVGLGVYALADAIITGQLSGLWNLRTSPLPRILMVLVSAVVIALVLASPQLIPAQELISASNRGDALNPQEATAFSLNPLLIGRTMLPSFDSQPFTEYISYIGVSGLALMVFGLFSADKRRWLWIALAALGLFFALGRGNPLYMLLVELPGFNLFRVPARWLVLWSLGASMLAGMGLATLTDYFARHKNSYSAPLFGVFLLIGGLMTLSLLADRAADEIDGSALPTLATWIGWTATLFGFAVILIGSKRIAVIQRIQKSLVAVLVTLELLIASQFLPFNDLSDPAVYRDSRFAINQMRALTEDQIPPGRFLSISGLLFDPGDKTSLHARWENLGLSDRAAQYAFTATKLLEIIGGNLPLTWDIASADGYGGGVLPTANFTAFSALLLPEGVHRTTDGRLREWLALPDCRGACIPEDRWLDLMNVQYLLTDKVYDRVFEGIFYDTQLPVTIENGEAIQVENPRAIEADSLHILYTCPDADCMPSDVSFDMDGETQSLTTIPTDVEVDGLTLARYEADSPLTADSISVSVQTSIEIHAMTLVDTRTGDFVQLTPPGWERIYSADVKIYENLDVLPRAFVVHEAQILPDTWDGTEQALEIMRSPDFDPAQTVVINTDDFIVSKPTNPSDSPPQSSVTITQYSDTEIVLQVESNQAGFVVLTDAFYPGWTATARRTPIYRADVMFRVMPIQAGETTLWVEYDYDIASDFFMAEILVISLGFVLWIGFPRRKNT